MAIRFEERTDGFRVLETDDGNPGLERMIASIETKYNAGFTPPTPMSDEEFSKVVAKEGAAVAIAKRAATGVGAPGVTNWAAKELDDCIVTSSVGPLTYGQLKTILDFIKKGSR